MCGYWALAMGLGQTEMFSKSKILIEFERLHLEKKKKKKQKKLSKI